MEYLNFCNSKLRIFVQFFYVILENNIKMSGIRNYYL